MKGLILLKPVLVVFIGMFLITGCVGTTVKDQMNNPGFQKENLPSRILRVGIYSDGTRSRENIDQLIGKTSSVLDEQVGIRLKVVSFQMMEWDKKESRLMLDRLHDLSSNTQDDFDITVAFTNYTIGDLFLGWKGVIDDSYRRFIILKGSVKDFIHEIGHSFIFSHCHSPGGVMMKVAYTTYFSPDDRKEVSENKWRDFDVKPELNESCRKDLLRDD